VGHERASILVVEDDAGLRMVCRVALELERFRVREADTVEAARAAIGAERPALVFLDLQLGAGESDELLDELHDAAIPVVIVSGTAELGRYATRAAGALGKPFNPAQLIAAARTHMLG